MTASPYGLWYYPPNYIWSFNDSPSNSANVAVLKRGYTPEQVASIASGGPQVLVNSVSATDSDGITCSAQATLNIYAPQQFPWLGALTTQYDAPTRVSPVIQRNPWGPQTLSDQIAYGQTVTWSISIGSAGGTYKFGINSPLTLALNLISATYGQTATVTVTSTYSAVLNALGPNEVDPNYYWVQKQDFWQEADGWYLAYGPQGFQGLQNMSYTRWSSGTKQAAQTIDHIITVLQSATPPP